MRLRPLELAYHCSFARYVGCAVDLLAHVCRPVTGALSSVLVSPFRRKLKWLRNAVVRTRGDSELKSTATRIFGEISARVVCFADGMLLLDKSEIALWESQHVAYNETPLITDLRVNALCVQ